MVAHSFERVPPGGHEQRRGRGDLVARAVTLVDHGRTETARRQRRTERRPACHVAFLGGGAVARRRSGGSIAR